MISRHAITLKVVEHPQNAKEYLFWNGLGNSLDMNLIGNVWNIIKKVIGNQIPCKREEMWDHVCD